VFCMQVELKSEIFTMGHAKPKKNDEFSDVSTTDLHLGGVRESLLTPRRIFFMLTMTALLLLFILDQANNNIFFSTLASMTHYLETCNIFLCILIIALLGILTPPTGAPYFPFPLLTGFVFFYRTGSHFYAICITALMAMVWLTVGSLIVLWLSRNLLQEMAERLSEKYPVVKALHTVFEHPGTSLRLQFLLRISPVIPSAFLSYILGSMPIRKREVSERSERALRKTRAVNSPTQFVWLARFALTNFIKNAPRFSSRSPTLPAHFYKQFL